MTAHLILSVVHTQVAWVTKLACVSMLACVMVATLGNTLGNAEEISTVPDKPMVEVDEAIEMAGSNHPLRWTLDYAIARREYLKTHVRDYSCQLVKRERIDGELQPIQLADVKVRCQRFDGEDLVQPLSVFMQYHAPKNIKGRRVLFVDGQNESQVLVRKGGNVLGYVQVRIDPNSRTARTESNYPITEIGFETIVQRLIHRIERDMTRDPEGKNTEVLHFKGAKVKDRVCTHIQVLHPEKAGGFEFHRASLYVDDELSVPIRLVVHGWPEEELTTQSEKKLPLLEEYTYLNLQTNVGLTDEDFSPSKLD